MTTIDLKVFGIVVTVVGDGGSIVSDLKETDGLQADVAYNYAMHGIESLILAHAVAGVNIATPGYIEAVETAVNACANM